VNKLVRLWIAQTRKISEGDKMAGRHGNKGVVSRILPESDMPFLPDGTPVDIILNPIGVPSRMNLGQVMETHLGWAANALGFKAVTPVFEGALDISVEDALAQAWLASRSGSVKYDTSNGQLSNDVNIDHLANWLDEKGYDFSEVIGSSLGKNTVLGAAKKACLEIWMSEEAGIDVTEMSAEETNAEVLKLSREKQMAAPTMGKSILYDGLTGEPFDQPVTTGYIYMMKLIHLIEDKIHARSTGPYSLITQQPLGGKAQFGGQRFGEMEVWALEAYSAAFNLQEMLTVKSDDVVGRVKTYESIVKGEDVIQPGIPESFHVLMKELQSLGLSVELLREETEDIQLDESEFSIDDFNLALESMTDSIEGVETDESEEDTSNLEPSEISGQAEDTSEELSEDTGEDAKSEDTGEDAKSEDAGEDAKSEDAGEDAKSE
jgi:DNA-directed RNA polymerase subunit beta